VASARRQREEVEMLGFHGLVLTSFGLLAGEATLEQDGAAHVLHLGADAFHSTARPVVGLRVVRVPGEEALAVLWDELEGGRALPHYALSLDGRRVQAVRTGDPVIRTRRAQFDPLQGAPDFAGSPLPRTGELYIVQLVTQPMAAYRRALDRAGASVRAALPRQAWVVRMDKAAVERVASLPFVRWIGPYHPEYRLDPELLRELWQGGFDGERCFALLLAERGASAQERVARAILALGGRATPRGTGLVLEAELESAALAAVLALDDVLCVDPRGAPELDTNLQRQISGAEYLEIMAGYRGQGVAGEILDSGFVLDHQEFQSPPLIVHGMNTGAAPHGTIMTSLAFATGIHAPATGILPDGQGIVAGFSAVADRLAHTQELLAAPYFAVFQSASWGSPQTTAYTVQSAELDDIALQTDLVLTQSMGSSGTQASRPEAWSKNVVGVGGVRFHGTLDKSDDTWSGSGSVGPAQDGRIKPDMIHVADGVVAAAAPPDGYSNAGGTSTSTAIVAGYVGLLHQLWHDGLFGNPVGATVFDSRPHAATARALLFNTSYQYPFAGAAHDLTRTHQGWGLPDLRRLYDERDRVFVVDERDVLQELQTTSYRLQVAPGAGELRATLVYTDLPGLPAAVLHRVNDLDLKVVSPSGTVYWGNAGLYVGNHSTPGGAPDGINTTENVIVPAPEAGAWIVEVIASEVQLDGHPETAAMDADYALVVHPVEPVYASFCTAKTALVCGPAGISASGAPSASATSGFALMAKPARGNRMGLLLYNTSAGPGLPFAQGGTLCVTPSGVRRGGPTNSLGTNGACDGVLAIDMNAFAQGQWVVPPAGAIPPLQPAAFLAQPGTDVFCQFWARDSVQTGELLSDGLMYTVGP
jgi:hypothetical protein